MTMSNFDWKKSQNVKSFHSLEKESKLQFWNQTEENQQFKQSPPDTAVKEIQIP